MSAPYFAPGGYAWRAMPGLEVLPWGPGRHVYEWLIWKSGNRRFELRYTDAQIADGIGRSRRYVQFGLAELTRLGLIVRDFVHKVNRWGNALYHRVIRVLGRAAGVEPKSKDGIDLLPKKLDPHRAKCSDIQSQSGAYSSLSGELNDECNKAAVVGEAVETAPPPAAGVDEAPRVDPAPIVAATLSVASRLAIRCRLGVKAPTPSPVASSAPRSLNQSPAAVLALVREKLARAELIAAQGDRAAMVECDELTAQVAALEARLKDEG
jgi:hypothetical protein